MKFWCFCQLIASLVCGQLQHPVKEALYPGEEKSGPVATAAKPTVLFLGPFAIADVVEAKAKEARQMVERNLGITVRMVIADPPYDVPEDIDGKGY